MSKYYVNPHGCAIGFRWVFRVESTGSYVVGLNASGYPLLGDKKDAILVDHVEYKEMLKAWFTQRKKCLRIRVLRRLQPNVRDLGCWLERR